MKQFCFSHRYLVLDERFIIPRFPYWASNQTLMDFRSLYRKSLDVLILWLYAYRSLFMFSSPGSTLGSIRSFSVLRSYSLFHLSNLFNKFIFISRALRTKCLSKWHISTSLHVMVSQPSTEYSPNTKKIDDAIMMPSLLSIKYCFQQHKSHDWIKWHRRSAMTQISLGFYMPGSMLVAHENGEFYILYT